MGCHTWFKVKVERTQEQAKEKWLFAQREYIWEQYPKGIIYFG